MRELILLGHKLQLALHQLALCAALLEPRPALALLCRAFILVVHPRHIIPVEGCGRRGGGKKDSKKQAAVL